MKAKGNTIRTFSQVLLIHMPNMTETYPKKLFFPAMHTQKILPYREKEKCVAYRDHKGSTGLKINKSNVKKKYIYFISIYKIKYNYMQA